MAAMDGGEDGMLSVWQWDSKARKAPILGKVATKANQICGIAFHPLDNHLVIAYGKSHLTFWTRRKDGKFDKSDMQQDKRYYLLNMLKRKCLFLVFIGLLLAWTSWTVEI